MSTAIYAELSKKMAMKIGGEMRPDFVHQRHWERFANETESKPRVIFDLCNELAKKLPGLAFNLANEFTKEDGSSHILRKICGVIETRSKRLLSRIEEGIGS